VEFPVFLLEDPMSKTTTHHKPTEPDAAPAVAAPVEKNPERDRDLAQLAKLQKEYDALALKATEVAKRVDPVAEVMAQKRAVTMEMDAIKRKHDLP
jgi:hypothetical protein